MNQDTPASPLQRGPVGTFYLPPSYQTTSGKGLRPEEKQALIAGFFVMASLAVAVGIGWWITPPSAPAVAEGGQPRQQAAAAAAEALPRADGADTSEDDILAPAAPPAPEPRPWLTDEQTERTNETAHSPAQESTPPAAALPAPPPDDARRAREAAARNEEVLRMKAQAYSETQKDRLGSQAKPAPKPDGVKRQPASLPRDDSSSSHTDLSRALAQCDNEVGLFFRERCKWRLCNGKWGKYGCPSYRHDIRGDYPIG